MKRICYLAVLLAAALLTIVLLVHTSEFPNKHKNGFNRWYRPQNPVLLATASTDGIIQDIAGATTTQFFFSTGDPEKIVTTTHLLQNKQLHNVQVNKKEAIDLYFHTAVDSPFVYIYAYNLPAIITADINTGKSTVRQLAPGAFSNAQALGNNTFVLRKLSTVVPDQFFVKVTTDTFIKESELSELHYDGGMTTDGILHYDPTTQRFTFVHYYNNEYQSFTTDLRPVSKGHTIDTFSHFRFELSENKHVFSSQGPDHMVNAASCVYEGNLYVRSTLRADNDNSKYKNNVVIDVYEISTGKYTGSFYLPADPREKINKLAIYNNILLMHCKDVIYAYQL
jgi:hypothetical protein